MPAYGPGSITATTKMLPKFKVTPLASTSTTTALRNPDANDPQSPADRGTATSFAVPVPGSTFFDTAQPSASTTPVASRRNKMSVRQNYKRIRNADLCLSAIL